MHQKTCRTSLNVLPRHVLSAFLLALTLLAAGNALAIHPVYRSELNGAAIRGYDTVAYFRTGKPVKGTPEFQQEWMDTVWHFSSAENQALFAIDPEKYAPQFGGYCAYALSFNRLYEGDPEVFRIVDGKLYLNNSKGAETNWLSETQSRLKAAAKAWSALLNRTE